MSASKKNTAKSIKSPAPATKETKPAAKAPAKKTVAKPAPTATETAKAAIVKAVTRVAAPAMTEAPVPPKPVPARRVTTTITARINVGFGNALHVRGEGPGLSWDRGVAMANLSSDLWQLELGEASRPFVFKFLVNDLSWSLGADYTLASGASETFTPEF